MIRANRPPDDWDVCPAGALQGLKHRLRSRRRIRILRNSAAVVVLLLGVTALGLRWQPAAHHGGMTCTQVREMATDYLDNKLTSTARREFKEHIDHCAHCRQIVDEIAEQHHVRLEPIPDEELIVARIR
jgi:hypothetical protein